MKIESKVRAGISNPQHNETLVRATRLRIKSGVRAGIRWTNHNETLLQVR